MLEYNLFDQKKLINKNTVLPIHVLLDLPRFSFSIQVMKPSVISKLHYSLKAKHREVREGEKKEIVITD